MMAIIKLFETSLQVANLGLESFFDAMKHQNVPAVHVEWKPPAGGDARLLEILEKLGR